MRLWTLSMRIPREMPNLATRRRRQIPLCPRRGSKHGDCDGMQRSGMHGHSSRFFELFEALPNFEFARGDVLSAIFEVRSSCDFEDHRRNSADFSSEKRTCSKDSVDFPTKELTTSFLPGWDALVNQELNLHRIQRKCGEK